VTDYERFVPILEALVTKINQSSEFTESDKTYLSAIISNQIHIQRGNAELINYGNIDLYEFTKTITYKKEKAS